MKRFRKIVTSVVLATLIPIGTAPAAAGPVERACNQSDRRASNRALCDCIGGVADQILTRREQRQAAKFFRDPHRAQEVRMSDRQSDENFWKRYKQFGSIAQQRCG